MTRPKRMTREDRAWIRGAAWALAEIEDGPSGGGAVEEALRAADITAATLRRAGVEEFDRDRLKAPLRNNRELAARIRARRSPSRPSPADTAANTKEK